MLYNSFQKGEFKSPYIQDGFTSLVNCDISTQLGTIKSQLALALDSATPNENCIMVAVPSGVVFAVSRSSGKIWSRATNGTWTLVRTNANGAHVGAGFFNNRLWFWAATKLGYFDLAAAWADSHGTFANSGAVKPFIRGGVNRAFAYIGDGAQLARVDRDNIFSANVLEIPLGETTTDIQEWGDDVVLTSIGVQTKIYRWNQYGDTYYKPDIIAYKDIDMLIHSQNSNIIYALCRTKDDYAEFMYYTGQELAEISERRIAITTASDSFMKTEFDGRMHFAVGTKIYTLRNNALVCEYTAVSAIQGMCTNGTTLFVSCGTNGVYTLGTNRAAGVIQTPIFEGQATQVIVHYDSIPAGTSLSLRVKINGGEWTAATLVQEEDKSRYVMRGGFPSKNVNFVQAEITLTPSTIYSPILRAIEII